MPKAVIFQTNLGGSKNPVTYKIALFVTVVKGFQLSAVN